MTLNSDYFVDKVNRAFDPCVSGKRPGYFRIAVSLNLVEYMQMVNTSVQSEESPGPALQPFKFPMCNRLRPVKLKHRCVSGIGAYSWDPSDE